MKEDDKFYAEAPYVCVKALEKGVNIIGVTRGEVTKIHHTEKLDRNEVRSEERRVGKECRL